MRPSFLARSSRLVCLQSKPKAQSNASPSGTPTPSPTAADLFDEDGELRHVVESVEGSVAVDGAAGDVIVTVAASLLLDEVEPDVRLNMTLPAGTAKGSVLPSVLLTHELVDELPGPQQKDLSSWNG